MTYRKRKPDRPIEKSVIYSLPRARFRAAANSRALPGHSDRGAISIDPANVAAPSRPFQQTPVRSGRAGLRSAVCHRRRRNQFGWHDQRRPHTPAPYWFTSQPKSRCFHVPALTAFERDYIEQRPSAESPPGGLRSILQAGIFETGAMRGACPRPLIYLGYHLRGASRKRRDQRLRS